MATANIKSSVMSSRAHRKSSMFCQVHIDDLMRGEMRHIDENQDMLRKKEAFCTVSVGINK